jgi:hypothetical protein
VPVENPTPAGLYKYNTFAFKFHEFGFIYAWVVFG